MIKLIFSIVLLVTLSNRCISQDLVSNSYRVQLVLDTKSSSYDSIINSFNKMRLPELEVKNINPNKLSVSFSSTFDSLVMQNIRNHISIRFEERYDFTEVSLGLSSIMPHLAMLGDRTTKHLAAYCENRLEMDDSLIHLGPFIGEFYRGDTALINELIKINSEKTQEELPSNLSFLWNPSSKKDTFQLYLSKKKKDSVHITENNIISICSSVKEIKESTDFDKNGQPTEWTTYSSFEISLSFDMAGSHIFKDLTNRLQKQYLTISVNGNIFSTPKIHMPINNGEVRISAVKEEFLFRFYSMLLFKEFDDSFKLIELKIKQNTTQNKRH